MAKREDNLIPGGHKLTLEEQKMGGKRSAEVRRQRKTMQEQMKMFAALPMADNKIKQQILEQYKIDPKNIDNQVGLIVMIYQEAMKGSMPYLDRYMELVGDKQPADMTIDINNNGLVDKLSTEEIREIAFGNNDNGGETTSKSDAEKES